eukprot:jgi/Astpho2/8232/Aster-x1502
MTPAGDTSFLIDVTPGANHSIVEEMLDYPRVMGDLTLLPDGRVFLCNGAQVADVGTTVAEIYDPSQPEGMRWRSVADSQIWRLYHSIAFLTRNAEVFVAGSEVTGERRVQLYRPDYLHTSKPRPVISLSPQQLVYGASFSINFTAVPDVDRVVLNRLTGSTHGNHFDQRQQLLLVTGAAEAMPGSKATLTG